MLESLKGTFPALSSTLTIERNRALRGCNTESKKGALEILEISSQSGG